MRAFPTVITTLVLATIVGAAPARAQESRPAFFDLRPELTTQEFEQFAGELGSALRFRQLGDAATVGRGHTQLNVQFADTSVDASKAAWSHTISRPIADGYLGRSISVLARFGVSDRVDIGAWGGIDSHANYGVAGVDTKIALLRQGPGRPVSVSIRPSLASLVGTSEVWVGNASVDLTVSRSFGSLAPYVGVAASTSAAMERSHNVKLDPVSAGESLAFAGVAYRWRALVLSAEAEKGNAARYGFSLGTRF